MRTSLLLFFLTFMLSAIGQSDTVILAAQKIGLEAVSDMSFDGRHTLWLNYKKNLHQFTGREFDIFEKKNIDPSKVLYLFDNQHVYYFYSEHQVFAFDKLKESVFEIKLDNNTTIDFLYFNDKFLFCQQSGILSIYNIDYDKANAIFSTLLPQINDVLVQGPNEFWIATNSGLRILKNGILNTTTNLLALFQTPIHQILKDSFNHIWFITKDAQLFKYNGSRLINVPTNWNSFPKIADAIVNKNHLWLLEAESGLSSYDFSDGQWTTYVQNDSVPFYGFKELCTDHFNHLWLGGPYGLMRVDLDEESPAPNLYIEDIHILFKSLLLDSTTRMNEGLLESNHILSPKDNFLSFHFSAGNLENGPIQFQYFLDGYHQDWSPWNFEKNVNYSALPPGNYRFKLRASANGKIAQTSSGIFTIQSPVWTPAKIKTLLLSIILIGIALMIYFILRNQRKRMNRLKMDLEIREASLAWQQKALQLQMNPHFIFNAINSIKGLIAQSDTKTARIQLQNFSNFLRGMLDMSRSDSIRLSEELNFLRNYLQLEQMMQTVNFEFSIEIEKHVNSLNPNIPPMMVQVFLENAIKHGFRNIHYTGVISIQVNTHGQNIRFILKDNGLGRLKASANASEHKSQAIKVIQDRLKVLSPNGKMERVKIIDLVDKDGRAEGTMVILTLPIVLA